MQSRYVPSEGTAQDAHISTICEVHIIWNIMQHDFSDWRGLMEQEIHVTVVQEFENLPLKKQRAILISSISWRKKQKASPYFASESTLLLMTERTIGLLNHNDPSGRRWITVLFEERYLFEHPFQYCSRL